MVTVVITVIVMLILLSIFIGSSTSSIDQASETKIKQEITEVKKGIDSVRLLNAKEGTDEETLNRGFIKVRVENAPESFVSFDADEITGYVVDLSTISYEKLKTGREYLTLMKGDVVTFDQDDVFAYDGVGNVYYLKGYQLETGELSYTDKVEERKDGPTVEVISTEQGNVQLKVTPKYGGEITSVIVGSKSATSTDGTNFEVKLTSNGSYIVIATEEGGNSTRTTLVVADITEEQGARPEVEDVYINDHALYTNQSVATLVVEAQDVSKMSISQDVLDVPSVNDIARWREYKRESSIMLKEGINQIYVWVKNDAEVSSDYKLAEVILDSIAPTRDEPTYIMDGFKLVITSNQQDDSEMTTEYGYKMTTETEYTWQESQIVLDVEPGATYDIITRATDIAGNVSESRPTTTTEILSIPDNITIEAVPESTWTSRVAVTISYPGTYGVEPFENIYRIDGGEWQKVSSNSVAMTIIANARIEAAVAAKLNGVDTKLGNIEVYDVENIDRVKPYIYDISETEGYYQEGYDMTFKIVDEESGLVAWSVTETNETPEVWHEVFEPTLEPVEGTFKIEKSGTYYIWGKDESGQIGSLSIKIENIDITDPVINSYQINYGTGKATIVAKATDAELGLVAYAFTKGQGSEPLSSDWVNIERTMIPYTMTKEVTENDYYAIWVKDISGRISHMEKYIKVIYAVTYDYKTNEGESISINGGNKLYVGCNSNVDLTPTSKRQYSSFVGWNTDPNAKGALDTLRIGDGSTGQEDITLYAIFKYEDKITFKKSSEATVYELTLTIAKQVDFTTLQYSYNGTTWTEYTEGLYMTNNKTVYARTVYKNEVITTDSITITNICENHNYKLATCLTESTCYYCGKYNGPALGHSMGNWYTAVEATCTTAGVSRNDCSRGCGYYEEKTIEALGHAYSAYVTTKAATCTATGVETSTCANCKDAKSRVLAALGHDLGEWYTSKTAKCTVDGEKRKDCSRCSYYETEVVAKLGHAYTAWVAVDDEEHTRGCSRCVVTEYDFHTYVDVGDHKECEDCGYEKYSVYVTLYTDGTLGFCNDESLIDGKTVQSLYGDIGNSRYAFYSYVPWYSKKDSIITVEFVNKVSPMRSTAYWFYWCSNLATINNISNLDTTNVTNMESMFASCESLTSVDMSGFNTAKVTNMNGLFSGCDNLLTVNTTGINTANVTDMRYMFYWCRNLKSVDVSGFDTQNVTNMAQMFSECRNLEALDVSDWNTAKVTSTNHMFDFCEKLTVLDVSDFDMGNVTDMINMFASCRGLTILDVSNWNTSNVTLMGGVFYECNNLETLDVSKWNTEKATDMGTLFYRCRKLTTIDVSGFKTSNVIDMSAMFGSCSSVVELDVDGFDTSNVKNMQSMFSECYKLKNLNVKNFITGNVTNMGHMFYHCDSLESIDVNVFETNKVTGMKYMFAYCGNLTSLDVSKFNTSNVTDMSDMFEWCEKLTSIDVSNFDTSNVTTMSNMFNYCKQVSTLNVSNFNTAKVTKMDYMFHGCENLTNLDVSNFNTSNVTAMLHMFQSCSKLTSLNVNNFDTSNVTSMFGMFAYTKGLTSLDLSNWNTINTTNMGRMFYDCSNLATLTLGVSFDKMDGADMFAGCNNLKEIETKRVITTSSNAIKLSTDIGLGDSAILYVPDRSSELLYEAAPYYETVFGAKDSTGDIARVRVKGYVYLKPTVDFANYSHYEFEAFYNVSTGSDYMSFQCHTWGGFEKLNIPIKNLTAGTTYTLSFTEYISDQTLLDGRNGCKVASSPMGETGEKISGLQYKTYETSSNGKDVSVTFTATSSTMYWIWDFSALDNNHYSSISFENVTVK